MKREIKPYILKDLPEKFVLLSGPRQSGKTYLSKSLAQNSVYLNYDLPEHRIILIEKSWPKDSDLIIFDELHKMPNWKSWLKGIFDTQGAKPQTIIIGSAMFDTYKKVGDSLAGRYFSYRMHPFTIKELKEKVDPKEAFPVLMAYGGFPEPFLKASESFYLRWKKSHLDIILRQDLIDLESVRDIKAIEILVELLRHRIGSPVSTASLARDLKRDPKTIKKWLGILENLYIIFKISPYHKNVARSLLKEPKYYFFDNGQVKGDDGIKLENLVACALKREADFFSDTTGHDASLHFLRTKDGVEADFFISIDNTPRLVIEVKWSDTNLSNSLINFTKNWPTTEGIQVVNKTFQEKHFDNKLKVKNVVNFLRDIDMKDFI